MLDLDQTTLPGIAHLLVETMIISDQIRAEDRANVLRALLLKHRSERHKSILQIGQPSNCPAAGLTASTIHHTHFLYRFTDRLSNVIMQQYYIKVFKLKNWSDDHS